MTQSVSRHIPVFAVLFAVFFCCAASPRAEQLPREVGAGPVARAALSGLRSFEPLGQCSRRTSLVISEIMYHPTNSSLEFVELFNSRGEPQDMSGYELSGSIDYKFPQGTQIEGQGFLVIARSPIDLRTAYGLTNVLGPYANNLPNSKGTVRLLNQAGAVLLQVNYDTQRPWPISPDGAGHSLVLARPSYGEDNVLAWAASDAVGGSPGALDPVTDDSLKQLQINELLANNGPSMPQFIELFNCSTQALDVSGCSLSDDPRLDKFIIPAGTVIAARGFLLYYQNQLGFALNPAGGTLYLRAASGSRVLDGVRYEAQLPGVSHGRTPDGSARVQALAQPSPGNANSPPYHSDIVINEIMYAPLSLNNDDQYIELYNRGPDPLNLSGWKFTSGISFEFPSNTVVQPNGYVVVARNAARMLTNYSNLNSANLVGNFGGSLSHSGERLALSTPVSFLYTNALGLQSTDIIYAVANEVTYHSGGQWGQWSDAGGSSLELIDPRADNAFGPNWADSDETRKASWVLVSATGTLDNGTVPADEIQLLLEGAGEVLVDNVEVLDKLGSNHVVNGAFESGAAGWFAEGTEKTSSLDTTEGFDSTACYHLRAVEKGDNQINRVRCLLSTALAAGTTNVTIRAMVRWLKGAPEILLRLRGNWLECAAELPIAKSLGTPGVRNSRGVQNAPPAITEVQHSPVLPGAGEPVLVTAQITDNDGIGAATLKYRLDPNSTYSTVPMADDGTGGDLIAGDGVWTATIPGQTAGTMIAFYVEATDKSGLPATATFPNDAPGRECLVRIGEVQPVGNYPVYRVWMTQSTLNAWNKNPRLDNSFNNITFVLDDRRVIYNSGARYKGSPYISPGYCGATCGRCGYSISFPADDLFLGETELVLDWAGGHGGETTAMQEQMCYWIADRLNLPWSHRYTIRLHVNGVTDAARQTTFEAVVQPAGSFLKEWVPNDPDGELFKIERAFEFSDSGALIADPEPRLQNYLTTGGVKKRERYRWTWMFRSTDRRDDYSNIYALVDAVNAPAPEPYTTATLDLVDMEEWMGIFATEHIINNFDAYGHEIGKNMYAYLPPAGKWQLYMFDLDWAMLAGANRQPDGPLFNADDPTITRMYAFPPFARAYWRAVQNAVNGPLDPANCNPVMDAKYRSLVANNIAWCDGQTLTPPDALKTWFSQRRAALQAKLATVAAPFSLSSVVVSNNIALVSGTAPVAVQKLSFNGVQWPLSWTSVSNWTAKVVLEPGTNQWTVVGVDPKGQPVADVSTNLTVTYDGSGPSAPAYIPYPFAGAIYTQDFDSLPNPGAISVNAANPVSIGGVTYSLGNPFGFADAVFASSNSGGLGIPELGGWYSLGSLSSKFGATDGDQTTGGAISFGLPNSSNRALGLLATSSTGATAFGARFLNLTAQTLNTISVQVTGELWRQSDLPKSLLCYYFIEPTGTAPLSGQQTALLPALNVAFPVNAAAAGGVAVDGTALINQTNLSLIEQPIVEWPPGAALWLVWQMTDPAGKAQGLSIDNLSFSASASAAPGQPPLTFSVTSTDLTISWTGQKGQTYQVEYKDDLSSNTWVALGNPVVGTGIPLSFSVDLKNSFQRFFRLRRP